MDVGGEEQSPRSRHGGEMVGRIDRFDWAATALGLKEGWSPVLRSTVDMVLGHGFPTVLLWGADLIQIYNDGYRLIMGDKHPAGLGQPTRECWPEVWHINQPIYERVRAGETLTFEDKLYPINRHGPLEDAWFTLTYSPVREDGRIAGVLVTVFETTARHEEAAQREAAQQEAKEAETHLRESEERLRTVLEGVDEQFYALDQSWRFLFVSRSALRIWGRQAEDVLGREFLEGFPEAEGNVAYEAHRRVMETRKPERFEAVSPVINRWIEVDIAPTSQGGLSVAFRDIDARKRAEVALRESEERQAFLLELSDTLRPLRDAVDIQQAAIRLLGRHLKVNRAGYYEVGSDENLFFLTARWEHDAVPLPERMLITDFGDEIREGYRAGRTMVMRDTEREAASEDNLAAVRAIQIRAWIGVPLVKEGRWVAAVGVHSTAPRDWTAAEISLVEEVGERTWAAAERARAETALRESEALRSVGFEGAGMGAWRWDLAGRLVSGDARFMALWGFPPSDYLLPLSRFTDRMSPDGAAETEAVVTKAIEANEEFDAPIEVVSGPNAGRWLRWRGRRVADDTSLLYGVSFDITEQKRTETALRESEARQAFLLSLTDALRSLTDGGEIERTATRLLGEHLQADRCFLSPVYEDGSGMCVREEYLRAGASSVLGDYTFAQFGDFVGPELHAGRILAVENVSALTNISATERASYAATEIQAYLLIPLVRAGRLAAFLTINHCTPRAWSEADKAVARQTADRLWTARERAQAEKALRETEARLRQFGEASQDVLWIRDAFTLQWEYLTPAFETIYGLDRESALQGDNMVGWTELILPEDRDRAVENIRRVQRGEWMTFEYRIRRPSEGAIRWLRNTDFPITDETGRVAHIGGIGHDITPLKQVEETLAATERRQRVLVEGMPQLVWRAVDGGEWTWASPQRTTFTGQAEPDSHGWGWLNPVHPDDRQAARQAWAKAQDQQALDSEYRIYHAEYGGYRWFHTRASPVRGDDGEVIEWLGTSTDVQELRELQNRQRVLLHELQHRVRNTLAVVRGIATSTGATSDTVEDFASHFEGRLSALARTQMVLTSSPGRGVNLEAMVREELLAQTADEDRIVLDGLEVELSPKAAEVLTLAVHELATNALKYGALSAPEGRVEVHWSTEARGAQEWLKFIWSENGVRVAASAPRREGFGTELIQMRVPYELRGHGALEFRPGGVRCEIAFPLTARASILQTDAP